MDVNGSRFQLLLGRRDFGRCTDDRGRKLGQLWQGSEAGVEAPVVWDAQRLEVKLRPEPFSFPAGRLDRAPDRLDRRGAGADRFGNRYWIGPGARSILVQSAGTGRTSGFWPGRGECAPRRRRGGEFAAEHPPAGIAGRPLVGAAVTEDHYLVTGTPEPAGLLVFDLVGGGGPEEVRWPIAPFGPVDIAARPGGGVFVLDVAGAGPARRSLVWELDRTLSVVPTGAGVPAAPSGGFRPEGGEPPASGLQLAAGDATTVDVLDPIAVEAAPDGGFLVLHRGPGAGSRVSLYREGTKVVTRRLGDVTGHDFARVGETLYVAAAAGNQAYAFRLDFTGGGLSVEMLPEYLPMRLFGGKGLLAGPDGVFYDFEDRWVPLVAQPRLRYAQSGVVLTPPLDSGEPGCVWHRLLVDACLPPGAALRVRSRAADEVGLLALAGWHREPDPRRRAGGPEVPHVATGPYDCHELLFQRARGRYVQLELELLGDGRSSPRVRAVRAWHPRFSYLERYLPAAYREDAESASFLDRFLANFEGLYTGIEERLAAAQVLLRADTSPADALDWLAAWIGLALDPQWDDARRRLMLRNAARFYGARGTIRGVELALRVVLDDCLEDEDFAGRRAGALAGPRIIEAFRTRRTPPVALGDPTAPEELTWTAVAGARWRPAEGREALEEAWRAAAGPAAPAPFPVADPGGPWSIAWRDFCRDRLGFIPELASAEAWRRFQARRRPGAVACPVPVFLPADGPELVDWFEFQAVVLPMARRAHRFTVLLPWPITVRDSRGATLGAEQVRALAHRIVDAQKPAHTTFGVRFFWAAFRVGEARLGDDTLLGQGSRIPEFVTPAVLGRAHVGESRLGGHPASGAVDRPLLCPDPREDSP